MEYGTAEVERLCQAVSPDDEPCDSPATVHCPKCGRWFCDAHAEDEEWHPCMLPPGDEGGEVLANPKIKSTYFSLHGNARANASEAT